MTLISSIAAAGVVVAAAAVESAGAPQLAGCYERVYDARHLAAHKGQLVTRATLSVTAVPSRERMDSIIANGNLRLWIRGRKQSFDSDGACWAEGDRLACGGSLSAAEADTCRSKQDGIHQYCRIDSDNPGSFRIEGKPEGVLVSIRERLELVPAPYDAGPYLYLSPSNTENHAFLLRRTPCP